MNILERFIKTLDECVYLEGFLSSDLRTFLCENDCKLEYIPSNSSDVYLLLADNLQLILKMGKLIPHKKYSKLKKEFTAYMELSKKSDLLKIKPLVYSFDDEFEFELLPFVDGLTSDKVSLSEFQILSMWSKLLVLQKTLKESKSEALQSVLNKHVGDVPYAEKLIKYVKRHMGVVLDSDVFGCLDNHLNSSRLKAMLTIVTDRNPTNWLIAESGDVTPIDFDMMLVEPLVSDFALFIDDYRLNTVFSRNELIDKLIHYLDCSGLLVTKKDFHYCAIYRNILHSAILFSKNKKSVPAALEKSLISAMEIEDFKLIKTINLLKNL